MAKARIYQDFVNIRRKVFWLEFNLKMDSIKQAIIENVKIEFLRHDYDEVCLIEI